MTWSLSASGTVEEVVASLQEQRKYDVAPKEAATRDAFALGAIAMAAASPTTHVSVSISGHAGHVTATCKSYGDAKDAPTVPPLTFERELTLDEAMAMVEKAGLLVVKPSAEPLTTAPVVPEPPADEPF